MKEFFLYFFGQGTETEFSLFSVAHFAPILAMLGTIFLTYRFRDRLRRFRFEKTLRYVLAFALVSEGQKSRGGGGINR